MPRARLVHHPRARHAYVKAALMRSGRGTSSRRQIGGDEKVRLAVRPEVHAAAAGVLSRAHAGLWSHRTTARGLRDEHPGTLLTDKVCLG